MARWSVQTQVPHTAWLLIPASREVDTAPRDSGLGDNAVTGRAPAAQN